MKLFNYIKNIVKSLSWPILFGVGQLFLIFIFTIFYNYNAIDLKNNSSYVNSLEYQVSLAKFLSDNRIFIVLISFCIFLPLFYRVYKKNNNSDNKNNMDKIIKFVFLGIILSIILNIILFISNSYCHFTNMFDEANVGTNLIILILCNCIIGPILEELLFRGILYNKFKNFNSMSVSILLTSIVFALFHTGIGAIFYAFFVGILLNIIYVKDNSLLKCIVVHAIINLSGLLFTNYLLSLGVLWLILILIISIIIFLKLFYELMLK